MLAVASSRIRISGSRSTARMKAMSCFWPRLTASPLDVTWVSSPCVEARERSLRLWSASRRSSSSSAVPAVLPIAVDDVVADGAGEEERLLQDEADPLRAFLRLVGADVAPVEQHPPARRVVQPRHQRRGRRLAAAGRPDERVGLAALERERRVVQHLAAARIAEADVLERQQRAAARGGVTRAAPACSIRAPAPRRCGRGRPAPAGTTTRPPPAAAAACRSC